MFGDYLSMNYNDKITSNLYRVNIPTFFLYYKGKSNKLSPFCLVCALGNALTRQNLLADTDPGVDDYSKISGQKWLTDSKKKKIEIKIALVIVL